MKKTLLSRSLTVAFSSTALCGVAVFAQTAEPAPQDLQRVEITGSSIKRVDAEGALPVTVITQQDIVRTGAVSVTDLIQALPSMQGFTTQSTSVNGGGVGLATASIHGIGERYTLVLLNGRRFAPANTGTTVNLNAIPLAAIERIEVLTDGASAVYGADAIAGVVNFILRKDSTEGTLTATANVPQKSGGASYNASVTKGFGDLEKDKFNILLSLDYDKQKELRANQRDFSKTGIRPFTYNGQALTTYFTSSNSVPANVSITTLDGNDGAFFSPHLLTTGDCGPNHLARTGVCRFDYSSQVDAIPADERTSLFGSGSVKVTNDWTAFTEIALSRFDSTPAYAPPAQPGIALTPALYNKDIVPLLGQLGFTPAQIAQPGDPNGLYPTMNLRLFDAGHRQDRYRTDTEHIVLGVEGSFKGVDLTAYYTHSQNKFTDFAMSGYTSTLFFNNVIASGAFDPITATAGQAASILAPGVLHQVVDSSMSKIDNFNIRGSGEIYHLPAGAISLGAGVDYQKQVYLDNPSAILQGNNSLQPNYHDSINGGGGGALPFNSSRHSTGEFAELVVPLLKTLELDGAARHDSFSNVTNSETFDATGNLQNPSSQSQGAAASSTTYKLSLRFQPTKDILLRGSYGTGFKSPSLANITNPVAFFGNTSGTYQCSFTDPTLIAACPASSKTSAGSQFNVLQGGNPLSGAGGLKPEKSTQWSFGFRVEPTNEISVGADMWDVLLKDRIDTIPEQVAFGNQTQYQSLFTIFTDPITGLRQTTFLSVPSNLGKAHYQGIDMDAIDRMVTPIGKLTSRAAATYMIRADYEVPGLPGYQTSVGQYGPNQAVIFRWQTTLSATLDTGPFSNTIVATLKPGYRDAPVAASDGSVRILNSDGSIGGTVAVQRRVASYSLFDYQGRYNYKQFTLIAGVKNLFDKNPPFSLQNAGGGNQIGYDGRYADPLGRQFYLTGKYMF